jgi:predicted nucleotidyltransferase
VIQTPDITEPNEKWNTFVQNYDTVVQGNPVVIKKFQESVDTDKVKLHFIPRVGHVSATKIREALKSGNEEFVKRYVAAPKVLKFLKDEIS